MTDATTPLDDGTAVGLLIGGRLFSFNLLNDVAGADAMGLVTGTPAANTLLGRLKAVADAVAVGSSDIVEAIGGAGGDASAENQATEIARLSSILAAVDGLEALLGPLATDATLTALSGKFPVSTGPKAQSGSLSVVPATGADLATNASLAAVTAALQSMTPADDVFNIVPSDTTDLPVIPKALRAKTAGTVSLKGVGGATVDYGAVAAGELIFVRARRIMATGTTATLVGFV